MSCPKLGLRLIFIAALEGCGTVVPETQDFPGNRGDQELLVEALVQSIHCDVGNAIAALYSEADRYPAMKPMTSALDKWGIQLVMSLKTEEKGTLNPAVLLTPPNPGSALFTLAGSTTLSSDAVRTDKLYFYYLVRDLKTHTCPAGVPPAAPVSSPLLQGDLKFRSWLHDILIPVGTGEISLPTSPTGPLKQNVIYYEVSFDVSTSASLAPGWKFTHVAVNPTGSLAAALRERTHDLQITMGPGDKSGLKGTAANAQLSGDVGLSVANGVAQHIAQ